MTTENKKVMVFGVFDNLHDGHRFFIQKALLSGTELYIVVTPTKAVQKIKGKLPFYSIKERIEVLEKEYPNARIIEGDTEANLWTPILKYAPESVVCGYDQDDLYTALEKIEDQFKFTLVKIKEDHEGGKLHSSLLHKNL